MIVLSRLAKTSLLLLGGALLTAGNTAPGLADGMKQAEVVDVSGVPTSNGNLVNGLYSLSAITKNGLQCYSKDDGADFWICMGPRGYWLIQPTEYLGKSAGYVISTHLFALQVSQSGPFQFFNGETFVDAPSIQIKVPSEGTATLFWTAALTAVASLVTVLVILCYALSSAPRQRSCAYRYISCTLTVFIAVHAVQPIWDNTLAKTTPMVAAIVGFLLFSILYGSLVLLGWKFQYSPSRLSALRTLWSTIIAFIGIFAFTVIQREALRELPGMLEGSIISDLAALIITVVGVLLFAWFVLDSYRKAADCYRVNYLQKAPSPPWSTMMTKTVVSPPKFGSCTSIFNTGSGCTSTQPVVKTEPILIDWGSMVREAEEEVAQLIMSFLINQTAIYLLTWDIPGLEGDYNVKDSNIQYWAATMAIFTLAAVVMTACRSSQIGRVLQLSMALAASWSLFRLAHSFLQDMYPRNEPLSRFSSACVVTFVSMVLMFLCDKAAGKGNALPGSIYSLRCTLALCFGVISGLAWHKTLNFAEHTLIEGTTYLSLMPWLSELVIPLIVAVLAARCWWTSILPRAEMTEPSHNQLIELEAEVPINPEYWQGSGAGR